MKSALENEQPIFVAVDRIFLDLDNPRHDELDSEPAAIERLCRNEQILSLAEDIAINGLNPLENFAVTPAHHSGKRSSNSYIVIEGNRRICALKLLHDSDRAPANMRKEFEKLAARYHQIKEVPVKVFANETDFRLWRDRMHGGQLGGVGRKNWNAEQKTRYTPDKKNVLAQNVLNDAEERSFLNSEERKRKLTTAQRFLSNPIFRETLGVALSDTGKTLYSRPQADYGVLLKKFIADLLIGKDVNSRKHKTDIDIYARKLGKTKEITGERIDPVPLEQSATTASPSTGNLKRPHSPQHITSEKSIQEKLRAIPSRKLDDLYFSICDLRFDRHILLIHIGVWAFFECLTSLCGRNDGTSFEAYLSNQKISQLGIPDKDKKVIQQALKRISEAGNATKHHDRSGAYNGPQLVNDMDLLKELICRLADVAKTGN
jgi:hypothetical protein